MKYQENNDEAGKVGPSESEESENTPMKIKGDKEIQGKKRPCCDDRDKKQNKEGSEKNEKQPKLDINVMKDSDGNIINLGDIIVENAKMMCGIQSKLVELSETSKLMESRWKKFESEREEDREILNSLHEHCIENRNNINFLHEMIEETNGKIVEENSKLDAKLDQAAANHANLVETVHKHKNEQDSCEQCINKLSEISDKTVSLLNEKGLEVINDKEFPTDKMVVAMGVPFETDENLDQLAKTMINDVLQQEQVSVIRTKRMSTWRNGKGLVKIELGAKQHVSDVVQNKQKLRHCGKSKLQGIFLRPSKTTQTLVAERNQDLILKLTGYQQDVMRKSDGTLMMQNRRGSDSEWYGRRYHEGRDNRRDFNRHHSVDVFST